ncbi:MAG: hypothetical protein ABDK87_05095 [Atribacterota bacterium]
MRKIFEKFTPSDFQFLAETLCRGGEEKRAFLGLVTNDYDTLNTILDNDLLFDRVARDEHLFVQVSPYLYFELLLRRAIRDIERESYTLERIGYRTVIPVFDGRKVLEVLARDALRDYLVELLVSFIRINNITVYIRRGRGVYFKKTLSDFDLDLLAELSERVDEPYRFIFLKRAGDIALFVSGIFPEQLFGELHASFAKRTWLRNFRGRGEELEEKGIALYRKASESVTAREYQLDTLLSYIADNFRFTKKPLNVMTDRYLTFRKYNIFEAFFN